ncbi:N-acetyltransferase [Enemella evansiae]|uniref:GNAT family N-acetyltransferase n=1 Tax=Enemella evansiae TaxID=2016499 RepID=UPI000B970E9A|nr:GNAT family N-acetyltransferase [Enemella evansiae]OYO03047.1 N-acetyltransferase [Enemella evansiae]
MTDQTDQPEQNDTEQFEVQDRADEQRYVLIDHRADPVDQVIGEELYVDTELTDGTGRILVHTGVSEAYGGQGLASTLVRSVVEDVIARGYKIVPVCPYVVKWLPKHPEYADHVVKPKPEQLRVAAERMG